MTLAVAVLALAAPSLQLELRPGAVHRYSLVRHYATLDGSETTEYREAVEYVVGKDDPTSVVMRRRLERLVLDGKTIPSTGESGWTETKFGLGADGTVWNRETAAEEAPTLLRQLRPLELRLRGGEATEGATWSVREGADPAGAMVPAEWSYVVESVSGDTVTARLRFTELEGDPIKATGEVKIHAGTGWPILQTLIVEPTIQPGDEERLPCILKITLARR